jgi:GNAT superfamily N-acetyltransferase
VERLRGSEEQSIRYGLRRYVQAAVDAEDRVVGFHMVATHPDEPETADVWDTGALREHRGHGLGLRLKAAATLWLLEESPGLRSVQTFNNHGNEHMVAVNRTMGYRRAEEWYAYQFPVPVA